MKSNAFQLYLTTVIEFCVSPVAVAWPEPPAMASWSVAEFAALLRMLASSVPLTPELVPVAPSCPLALEPLLLITRTVFHKL